MSLTSPRFRKNLTLKTLIGGGPMLRKGSRGRAVQRAVHLIQFALIDLGEAMPRSTGGAFWSPDGIFGGETHAAMVKFQRSKGLSPDGIVGPKTMRALDKAAAGYRHRVRLHFISISLTDVGFENLLRKAREAFDQYAIDLQYMNGQSLLLSKSDQAMFNKIDQQCKWDLTTGEYAKLQSLGRPVPSNEITIYFVNKMQGVVGCGGHMPGRPAATVAKAAGAVDLGHELGHVLLSKNFTPVHHPHLQNIMSATGRNETWTWVMTRRQIQQMRIHTACQPC
ncbi:MAG: peptidoglycan-binding protein [Pirellulaceae bacterium]|nr:peptidoglycan-binding protein [Pirellulaceae bacterium]